MKHCVDVIFCLYLGRSLKVSLLRGILEPFLEPLFATLLLKLISIRFKDGTKVFRHRCLTPCLSALHEHLSKCLTSLKL